MTSAPKVLAVIPAYNEAGTLRRVVEGLRPYVSGVIVVDDGSTDATRAEALAGGATVLSRGFNKGYDATVNEGFEEAARQGADIIMTFDADGEHAAEDVPHLLAPLLKDQADLVIGLRPETRHWSESLFAWYTKLRWGVRDPMCGMKAYRRELYDRVGFFDSVSSIGSELTLRALKLGYRPAFIDITLLSRPEGDASRFYAMSWRGNMKILGALLRIMRI